MVFIRLRTVLRFLVCWIFFLSVVMIMWFSSFISMVYYIDWFYFIYLFIWLHQILVEAPGLPSCGMRTLSCSMHVGSSSLTRDWTQAPCIGSTESCPLCHQGSPYIDWFSYVKSILHSWDKSHLLLFILSWIRFASILLINSVSIF